MAKPMASILDLAGKTAQSIRNSTRPYSWHAIRVRPPRHVGADTPLRKYSWEQAVGRAVLLEAEGGRLREEAYLCCVPLARCGSFALLTGRRLLKVASMTLTLSPNPALLGGGGREWEVEWEAGLETILRIDREGAVLTGKQGWVGWHVYFIVAFIHTLPQPLV